MSDSTRLVTCPTCGRFEVTAENLVVVSRQDQAPAHQLTFRCPGCGSRRTQIVTGPAASAAVDAGCESIRVFCPAPRPPLQEVDASAFAEQLAEVVSLVDLVGRSGRRR